MSEESLMVCTSGSVKLSRSVSASSGSESSHQSVPGLPCCHVFMFVLMPDAGTMSSDVAEADTSLPVHHCTVCRCKIDVNKPDSAYQHSLLGVLLCKVCKLFQYLFFADPLVLQMHHC